MSSSSTILTPFATDQRIISSYNRGPITSVWALPASCTATLSLTTSDGATSGVFFFGHFGGLVDELCFPTGTSAAVAAENWNIYYRVTCYTFM